MTCVLLSTLVTKGCLSHSEVSSGRHMNETLDTMSKMACQYGYGPENDLQPCLSREVYCRSQITVQDFPPQLHP